MKKLNVDAQFDQTNNRLVIHPENLAKPQSAISTYNDHRMAMAFSSAAQIFGQIEMENPMVVNKSFPHFWEEMKKFGISLS